MSRRYNFGELVMLSKEMQPKLPGALLEAGYAIAGPNEAGYYTIVGPELESPAYISGDVPFFHPVTGQLLYQPYIPPPKKKSNFPIFGWIILIGLVYFLASF